MRTWGGVGALLAVSGWLGNAAAAQAQHVYYDEHGRLRSEADEATNRIADFSHAGYEGGGGALPDVPTVETVEPFAGDNTASLQAAIDAVAAMPMGADGYRGAVELAPGRYEVAGTVRVPVDGIVLRGSGDGTDLARNTAVVRVGANEDPVIVLGGSGNNRWRNEIPDSRSDIVSDFVQVGSMAFEIADPDKFEVGDNIVVFHPCTDAWLATKDYGATGTEPPWPVGGYPLVFNRIITRIDGDMIHVDAPVFDHLDRALAQSYIYRLDRAGLVSHVGLEDLRVEIDSDVVMHAVSFDHAENGFARRLTVRDFLLGGIHMTTAKHLTVQDVRAIDPKGPTIGGRKYNFMAASAQLVLVQDSYARGGRHSFASNGTSWDSGVVFLRGVADGSLSPSEGHHRWSMGLLYDGHTEVNVVYDGVLLGLYNRGDYGSGHGWATAHSVAYNCDLAGGIGVVQQPPGAQNWAIGCSGQISGNGPFDHPTGYIEQTGSPVEPVSLYDAQLADRLEHPPQYGEPPAGHEHLTFEPVADAYVRGGEYASTNYGSEPALAVKTGNPEFTREAYLRFELQDVPEATQVQLRLRQEDLGIGGMRYAIALVEEDWDEQSITFDNRPAEAEPFAHFFPEQASDTLIDLTDVVDQLDAPTLSVRIWATAYYGGRAQADFGSREAAEPLRPALVYTVPVQPDPGTTGGDTGSDGSGTTDGNGSGSDGADTTTGTAPTTDGNTQTSDTDRPDDRGQSGSDGCTCRTSTPGHGAWLALPLLLGLRRRR